MPPINPLFEMNHSIQRKCGVVKLAVMAGAFCLSTVAGRAEERSASVNVMRIPGATNVMKAATGADGTIHVLFDAEDGPQYVRSRDGGATFSAPVAVLDAASRKPGLKFTTSDLAVGPDGRVHVVTTNNAWKLKLPQDEWGFYYSTLAPGAQAFSPMRNLNHKPSEGFSLAAGRGGSVTALFLAGKVFAMDSRDAGRTFTASAEIDASLDPCNCCTTSAAYGPDGRLAIFYREKSNDERDMYVALWDQGGKDKPVRMRVSGTPWKLSGCPMTYYTIQPTSTGYVAAWPTRGQVYFARLDQNGAVVAPGEIKTAGTSGMRTNLLAVSGKDGATLVAWKNDEKLGWQLYDPQGHPQGERGSVSSVGNGAAGAALLDGRFVLFP